VVGSTLFFAGYDKQGWNLWKSDGTKAGTVQVKDIHPGDPNDGYAPRSLTAFGGKLYFIADDGAKGPELWTSDGTAAGTKRVKDIRPGAAGALDYGSQLVGLGSYLYFAADDGVSGLEIWRSNGTAAGTSRVTDVAPGPGSAYPYELLAMGGALYFAGTVSGSTWGVYSTTGSGQNEIFAPSGFPQQLTPIGTTLYFQANDGLNGDEIWRTVGGAAATAFTNSPDPLFQPRSFTKVGSSIYFVAYDSTNGTELWKTDGVSGASPNTAIAANINPGLNDSSPLALTEANGVLYFGADDGTHRLEPWRTTPTGVELVADINPNDNSLDYGGAFLKVGTNLYFAASNWGNGAALELWKIPL
jgi:ELWxxDGT repeat protein